MDTDLLKIFARYPEGMLEVPECGVKFSQFITCYCDVLALHGTRYEYTIMLRKYGDSMQGFIFMRQERTDGGWYLIGHFGHKSVVDDDFIQSILENVHKPKEKMFYVWQHSVP